MDARNSDLLRNGALVLVSYSVFTGILDSEVILIKAKTSVCCPKMKRDAGVKCCLFTIKKTAFHSSVSLHFWVTNGGYGFRLYYVTYYPGGYRGKL